MEEFLVSIIAQVILVVAQMAVSRWMRRRRPAPALALALAA